MKGKNKKENGREIPKNQWMNKLKSENRDGEILCFTVNRSG